MRTTNRQTTMFIGSTTEFSSYASVFSFFYIDVFINKKHIDIVPYKQRYEALQIPTA